jgi:hypothetical protein
LARRKSIPQSAPRIIARYSADALLVISLHRLNRQPSRKEYCCLQHIRQLR